MNYTLSYHYLENIKPCQVVSEFIEEDEDDITPISFNILEETQTNIVHLPNAIFRNILKYQPLRKPILENVIMQYTDYFYSGRVFIVCLISTLK